MESSSHQGKPEQDRIAIIGIGCRFPGASDPSQLWKILLTGTDAVGTYPGGRFQSTDIELAEAIQNDSSSAMASGGFIEDIEMFDAAAFELSPREAAYVDPQHRLLMEVAWQALEDAGQPRMSPALKTGVFTGLWASDFENALYATNADLEIYALTGTERAGASGRLSYTFGFQGPSLTVDAACSSSLVAIHMACQSLLSGECDMALAGGANAILATGPTRIFTRSGMLSPDGRCKFGDARADGFVRSEGAGIVVLKRLSDALADKDPIHAIIRGSAVNNDGRTSGALMTPSREGQRQTLHRAWRDAGIRGKDIRYIEAHGTGTAVGDPVEIGAIGDALKDDGTSETCWVGSIKSNLGHTESAAGIAGLIKVILALKHRLIPRSLHVITPNPKIEWDDTPVRLLTEAVNLSMVEIPILAGVSSFGLTGTNAHLIVEEFCESGKTLEQIEPEASRAYLLPISARTGSALDALALEYAALGSDHADGLSLRDLCYTASVRRRHDEYRASFVCGSLDELKEVVDVVRNAGALSDRNRALTADGGDARARVVFIAPGQGSQWAGMGRQLCSNEPVFRHALEKCDAAIQQETGWSLIDLLHGSDVDESLQQIDIIQPALFAMSIALAALWKSWGIEPDAVIGHSMGEVAAAHIAGVLSLPDAAAIICRRSRLMKTIRGSGAMLTIELPLDRIAAFLDQAGGKISVAASNSPDTTVVAGDSDAISLLEATLSGQGIFCRRIKVDVASHSDQVDPILAKLKSDLGTVRPQEGLLPILSTVLGRHLSGEPMDAGYWAKNLRQPVRYAQGIHTLAREGYKVFVELSPHPVLLPATEATLRAVGKDWVAVASTRRGKQERSELLQSLGILYEFGGCNVRWENLYPEPANCVPLPQYPFQRERCWPNLAELEAGSDIRTKYGTAGHPFLGRRFESSMQPDTILWEIVVNLEVMAYLRDHRVHGSIVLPASVHAEIVLEALRAEAPAQAFSVTRMRFEATVQISERGDQEFQLALHRRTADGYTFEFLSRAADETAGDEKVQWTVHSHGETEVSRANEPPQQFNFSELKKDHILHIEKSRHYTLRRRSGIDYGTSFQLVQELWIEPERALCRIARPTTQSNNSANYMIHPTVLDSCLQSLHYVQPNGDGFLLDDTLLPISIARLRLEGPLPTEGDIFCLVTLVRADPAAGVLRCDLSFTNEDGRLFGEAKGVSMQRVSASLEDRSSELLLQLVWNLDKEMGKPAQFSERGELLLIFCDSGGVGDALAANVHKAGGRSVFVRRGQQFAQQADDEYLINTKHSDDLSLLFGSMIARGETPSDTVYLWALDQPSFEGVDIDLLLHAQEIGSYFIPTLVQAMAACDWTRPPRLWIATRGAVTISISSDEPELTGAPMWGIGAVVAVEHPELRASLIDLSPTPTEEEMGRLFCLILSDAEEDRIALRGDEAYVARLIHAHAELPSEAVRSLHTRESYAVETVSPGILDNLVLRAAKPKEPRPGEVAIEVVAAGLNFIDVTKALGIFPGVDPKDLVALGAECAGRIVAIGRGVEDFEVGDEIVAFSNNLATNGLLTSHACLPVEAVAHKPLSLSFEQACALPIAYLTAHYSLVELARMRAGEWILIPAGAGGVGLAAIHIALRAGVHIIATASTPEKRSYLQSLGVEHVLPSRTLSFDQEVMRITSGRGVDIVLNSLADEYIPRSFAILRPFGRFIELGKQDIYKDRQIGLRVFRNNLSYYAVDLAAAIEQRLDYVSGMFHLLIEHIEADELPALPVQTFTSADPGAPFRFMAQGNHTGKIVINMDPEVLVLPPVKKALFRRDRTYLVTGGMGGVGSKVAEWMAENGAGCLVLASRREESDETRSILHRIESFGARVLREPTDIVEPDAVNRLISKIRREMPPLAGIMHAAALIDDALIVDLVPSRFASVMAPKVKGTWNLYKALSEEKLDFMILFSSIAAVHPQPGHGSYATANAFMDAFAHYARANGQPVSSINWGGWNDLGLARRAGTGRNLAKYGEQGLANLSLQQALSALKRIIETDIVQTVAIPFDLDQALAIHAHHAIQPLLCVLLADRDRLQSQGARQSILQNKLSDTASRIAAIEILAEYLIQELGRVLKLASDRIRRDTTFGSLGLDSLMTLEFVRRLHPSLGIAIPTTAVFNHPTVDKLAEEIAKRLQLHCESPVEPLKEKEPAEVNLRAMAEALVYDEISDDDALLTLMNQRGD